MKGLNLIKNIMLTVLITMLYAIWSKEQLHALSGLHMWAILIAVGALILHLLVWIDQEVYRIQEERKGKTKKRRRSQKVVIKHVDGKAEEQC